MTGNEWNLLSLIAVNLTSHFHNKFSPTFVNCKSKNKYIFFRQKLQFLHFLSEILISFFLLQIFPDDLLIFNILP